MMIPGSGEPNFDSWVADPYQAKRARREQEVRQLLDKLKPEMIVLDPSSLGQVWPSQLFQSSQLRVTIIYLRSRSQSTCICSLNYLPMNWFSHSQIIVPTVISMCRDPWPALWRYNHLLVPLSIKKLKFLFILQMVSSLLMLNALMYFDANQIWLYVVKQVAKNTCFTLTIGIILFSSWHYFMASFILWAIS